MGRVQIYLVRHGAVANAPEGAYYGGTEVPLSPAGRREAVAAARFLGGVQLSSVWTSPLARARFGAVEIARLHPGIPLRVDDRLREIDRGRWVGWTPAQVAERWPGDLRSHAQDLDGWRGHGGESYEDLRRRVLAWLRDRIEEGAQGPSAVVAHLFPIRAILAEALDLPLERWTALQVPTGSLSLIARAAPGWELAWYGVDPAADGHSTAR